MPRRPKTNKKKPIIKIVQAAFNRATRNDYDVLHSQYTGYHSKLVELVVPKKIIDTKSQFLVYLSTGLKEWYSAVSGSSEIEIQIALYNESCIIISSNKNDTKKFLYDNFVKKSASSFLRNLHAGAILASERALKSVAVGSHRIERNTRKLAYELVKDRDTGLPLLDELEHKGKDICMQFDAADDIGVSFARFLNREEGMEGKHVALITSSGAPAHAEQKILLAMCKAAIDLTDRTLPIIFAGTFRPCRGCFESLSVVQKYCFGKLQFGVRPGHFWTTTTRAHVDIIECLKKAGLIKQKDLADDFDESGRMISLTDTTYRPVLRSESDDDFEYLHYCTDSDSD